MDALIFLWELLTRDRIGIPVQSAIVWWIPLVIAVAAAALSAKGEAKKEKRQQRLTDALEEYQLTKAAEGRAAVERYGAALEPEQQAGERAAIETELRGQYAGAAERAAAYEEPEEYAGRKSARHFRIRGESQQRTTDRLNRAIGQLAVIGTPARRNLAQSLRFGQAATDVDAANIAAARLTEVYGRIIGQQRAPAWANVGSQVLGGVAGGMYGGRTSAPSQI